MSSIRVTRVSLAESAARRVEAEVRRRATAEATRDRAIYQADRLSGSAGVTVAAQAALFANRLGSFTDALVHEREILTLAAAVNLLEVQHEFRRRLRNEATAREIAVAGGARTSAVHIGITVAIEAEWHDDDEAIPGNPPDVALPADFDGAEFVEHIFEILARANSPLPERSVEALVQLAEGAGTRDEIDEAYERARDLVDEANEAAARARDTRELAVVLAGRLGDVEGDEANTLRELIASVLEGDGDSLPLGLEDRVTAIVEAEAAKRWRVVLADAGYMFDDVASDTAYAGVEARNSDAVLRARIGTRGTAFAPVVPAGAEPLLQEAALAVDVANCDLADQVEAEAAEQGLVVERVVDRGPGRVPPEAAVDVALPKVQESTVRQERADDARTSRRRKQEKAKEQRS